MRVATSPHDFKLLVAAQGRSATSMDDVGGGDPAPAPSEPVVATPRAEPPPAPAAPSSNGPAPSVAPPSFG
jgi:hypothetical protein